MQAVYYGIISDSGSDKVDLDRYPAALGVTIELCAGIVDKAGKSLVEIATEEVHEECGYKVPCERLELILTYRSGVGTSGSLQTLFYCEVTDEDRDSSGGGVDGEIIEVIEHSLEEARCMVSQGSTVTSPPSCLLGLLWFLTNRAPK